MNVPPVSPAAPAANLSAPSPSDAGSGKDDFSRLLDRSAPPASNPPAETRKTSESSPSQNTSRGPSSNADHRQPVSDGTAPETPCDHQAELCQDAAEAMVEAVIGAAIIVPPIIATPDPIVAAVPTPPANAVGAANAAGPAKAVPPAPALPAAAAPAAPAQPAGGVKTDPAAPALTAAPPAEPQQAPPLSPVAPTQRTANAGEAGKADDTAKPSSAKSAPAPAPQTDAAASNATPVAAKEAVATPPARPTQPTADLAPAPVPSAAPSPAATPTPAPQPAADNAPVAKASVDANAAADSAATLTVVAAATTQPKPASSSSFPASAKTAQAAPTQAPVVAVVESPQTPTIPQPPVAGLALIDSDAASRPVDATAPAGPTPSTPVPPAATIAATAAAPLAGVDSDGEAATTLVAAATAAKPEPSSAAERPSRNGTPTTAALGNGNPAAAAGDASSGATPTAGSTAEQGQVSDSAAMKSGDTGPHLSTDTPTSAISDSARAPSTPVAIGAEAAATRPIGAAGDTAAAARSAAPQNPVTHQVAVHLERAVGDGHDRFQIQLSPPDLGRIDVRLEISSDGRVSAVFGVDRQQTLDLLQRDSRDLQRALQDSGLRADSGSLSFNLRGEGRGNQSLPLDLYRDRGANQPSEDYPPADVAAATRYSTSSTRRLDIQV